MAKDFNVYKWRRDQLNEDNDLPAGAESDPNAPWNQRDRGPSVKGKVPSKNNVIPVTEYSGQYLFFDKNTKHYIFTLNDAFSDIFNLLDDYLDKEPGTSSDEWRDYVSDKDILRALARYINDGKADLAINRDEYEDGDYEFLLVTKENFDEVKPFLPSKFTQIIQQANNLQ